MSSIQWFPGHMNAAKKSVAAAMAKVDVVIEVVDARLPAASSNPLVHELRLARQRPFVRLLNKADLADPAATRAWIEAGSAEAGQLAVAISCKKPAEAARLPALAKKLAPQRGSALKPLRLLIMGVPNVGKSTLINALAKRKIAKVADQPAITRLVQRIDVDPTLIIYDTPGLLWPKIETPEDGLMLAASHAVGVNAYDDLEVAAWLADFLLAEYPPALATRYRMLQVEDGHAAIAAIAEKRGCRQKGGGAPDLERAAAILLNDYRSGALGRISLETPALRAARLRHRSADEADPADAADAQS